MRELRDFLQILLFEHVWVLAMSRIFIRLPSADRMLRIACESWAADVMACSLYTHTSGVLGEGQNVPADGCCGVK